MYKLLIADDEALEREGLELMIRRMLPDRFVFFHAENGRRAIQQAEEHRPDFIFMDIKMPGIQGLEAIREIRRRLADVRVVLVTAHDFFAYAKEAVSLGVKEYLLKPAKREELREVLERLVAEKEDERRRREAELQQREKLSRLLPLAERELALYVMEGGSRADAQLAEWAELLGLRGRLFVAAAVVLPGAAGGGPEADAKQGSEAAGAGGAATELEPPVQAEALEALRLYAQRLLPCVVGPWRRRRLAVALPAADEAEAATRRLEAEHWARQLEAYAADRFGWTPGIGVGPVRHGWEGLRDSYREAQAEALTAAGAADGADASRWSSRPPQPHWLERALELVGRLYRTDLSMEETAEAVNLSPHYFSKGFKQLTGENFVDYVTRLRIAEARRLLVERPDLSLKEICYESGYNDPNYFSRIFKKTTGLTPSEYRQASSEEAGSTAADFP